MDLFSSCRQLGRLGNAYTDFFSFVAWRQFAVDRVLFVDKAPVWEKTFPALRLVRALFYEFAGLLQGIPHGVTRFGIELFQLRENPFHVRAVGVGFIRAPFLLFRVLT